MTIRKLRQRVRSVRDRARLERELDVELQFHLDMLAAENVRAGMTADEARRCALQTFGPLSGVKDDVRDAWLSRTIEMAAHDVRYGLRMLAASPAFAIGVIVTIALAVGVNTAIFGTAYSLLLKPLPFDKPQSLVVLQHGNDTTGPIRSFSYPELTDYRRVPGADDIAELHTMWFILLGKSEPERVSTGVVSTNYFSLLGIQPLLGRTLLPSDDRPGAAPVLVLSFDYWMRTFAGDRSIVGRAFEMNDRAHTVVGVLPPFPSYPQPLDVYMPTSACPFRSRPGVVTGRTMRMSSAVARMKDGISLADFNADLERMSQHLRSRYPETYAGANAKSAGVSPGYSAIAIPLAGDMQRALRPTLLLLLATAVLVLLIACVSVSNLALSRLVHRAREVSLRAALGASRARLIRQLLTENVAVVVLGAVLGLVMARAALGTLTAYAQRATTLPVDSGITGPALAAAVAVSVVLLLTSAVLPVVVRRTTLNGATPQPPAGRVRYGLVIGQVALSFVLTAAAALSVRSLLHLQGIDVGFPTEHLQMMRLDLNFTKYADYAAITKFWREFERQLTEVPGVAAAGGAGTVPLDGQPLFTSSFNLEGLNEQSHAAIVDGGRSAPAARSATPVASRASIRVATPGYFAALGQPLVAGRTFTRDDVDPRMLVVVVNQTLARRYWPDANVVGRRIRVEGLRPATVIGVVEDTRQRLDEPPGGEIYLPLLQTAQLSTHWLIRSRHPAEEVERRVRDVLRAIDPQQPVDNFRTLASLRDDSLLPSRVTASVVSLFSLLALLITATGIGGVIGFAVQQRRHEFGVRLALGAQRHRLVAMVVGDGLRLVCIGLSLGGAASLTMFPVMRFALAGVRRFDPASLLLVSALLLAVAAAACFIPARRAARVDPLLALRAN